MEEETPESNQKEIPPETLTHRKRKNQSGRPRKTIKDLPKGWEDIVRKGSLQGKTEAEIIRDICISRGKDGPQMDAMWARLKERDAEFRKTLDICKVYRKAWWEEQGRKSLKRRYFQDRTWFAIMKNCFGYVDKVDVEHGMSDELLEKYKEMSEHDLIESTKLVARAILALTGTEVGRSQAALPGPA